MRCINCQHYIENLRYCKKYRESRGIKEYCSRVLPKEECYCNICNEVVKDYIVSKDGQIICKKCLELLGTCYRCKHLPTCKKSRVERYSCEKYEVKEDER